MKILFVHQNFPGQFPHLAPALVNRGHHVLALTSETNTRPSPVKVVKYRKPAEVTLSSNLTRMYADCAERGLKAAFAARQLRDQHDYHPDVIFGHSGWGETLFLKEVWPRAKLLVYAELMYRIDTGRVRPDPNAFFEIPETTLSFRPGDELLTFVNRSLEPYRGFHSFMRALPAVLEARPKAHVAIVGEEGQSYGAAPKDATSWKQKMLDEVGDRLDLSRVHFLGRVAYPTYLSMLQVSRCHAYLTYPFVLSWSLMESMAAGCMVVGSDTDPVREVIKDGRNGKLVDFFDIEGWSAALTDVLANPAAYEAQRAAARRTIFETYDLHGKCLPKLVEFVERAGHTER